MQAPALPPVASAPHLAPQPLATAPFLKQTAAAETLPAATVPHAPPDVEAPPPVAPRREPQPRESRESRNIIRISKSSSTPRLDPLLSDGYAALKANHLDAAGDFYNRLLKEDPKNADALLGLAAIAVREGRKEDATQYYMQLLRADPHNALAQAGLIALLGRADPLAAESRLKHLIAHEPSAYLYFTLGNLYADGGHWAQAQDAYFRAHHLEPDNPDYAYNLAVGLEHVGQRKLALTYYQQAIALAAAAPRVNFDLGQAEKRAGTLAALAQ